MRRKSQAAIGKPPGICEVNDEDEKVINVDER
jgi:hypothetical protein